MLLVKARKIALRKLKAVNENNTFDTFNIWFHKSLRYADLKRYEFPGKTRLR